MKEFTNSLKARLLAALIAALLIFGALPLSIVKAAVMDLRLPEREDGNKLRVHVMSTETVQNSQETTYVDITGATVNYTIESRADGSDEYVIVQTEQTTAVTGEDGLATIPTDFLNSREGEEEPGTEIGYTYYITATVTADGYLAGGIQRTEINLTEDNQTIGIHLWGLTVTFAESWTYDEQEHQVVSFSGTPAEFEAKFTINKDGETNEGDWLSIAVGSANNIPKISEAGTYTVELEFRMPENSEVTDHPKKMSAEIVVSEIELETFEFNPEWFTPYGGADGAKYDGQEHPALAKQDSAFTDPETNDGYSFDFELVTVTREDSGNNGMNIPTVSAIGNYEVTVTASKPGYTPQSYTYQVKIIANEIEGLPKIVPNDRDYDGTAQYALKIENGDENSIENLPPEFTYWYSDDGIQWQNTCPKITDAGTYKIQFKVSRDNYNPTDPVEYTVTINKIDQTLYFNNFSIDDYPEQRHIVDFETEGENANQFDFSATGDPEEIEGQPIVYTVTWPQMEAEAEENLPIRALISNNGQLKVNYPGIYTVTATRNPLTEDGETTGNPNYNSAEISFTIAVKAKDETKLISFPVESVTYPLSNGTLAQDGESIEAVLMFPNFDQGEITYSIVGADENGCLNGFGINPDGTVTVVDFDAALAVLGQSENSCQFTVHAEKAAFESIEFATNAGSNPETVFHSDSAEYMVTVIQNTFDDSMIEIVGTLGNLNVDDVVNNHWYVGETTRIKVKNSNHWLQIRTFNSTNNSWPDWDWNNWEQQHDFIDGTHTIEVRTATGRFYSYYYNISEPRRLTIAVDKTAPSDISFDFSAEPTTRLLNSITFGFYQPDVEVTITAKDETSGLDKATLLYIPETDDTVEPIVIGTKNFDPESANQDGTNSVEFTFSEISYRGHLQAVVYDKAGNNSSEARDEVFVVDTNDPNTNVTLSASNSTKEFQVNNEIITARVYNVPNDDTQRGCVITIKVNDDNFFYDTDDGIDDVTVLLYGPDGSEEGERDIVWEEKYVQVQNDPDDPESGTHDEFDHYEGTCIITHEGLHRVVVRHQDGGHNNVNFTGDGTAVEETDENGNPIAVHEYELPWIYIDSTPAEIEVSFDDNEQKVIFTVTEENFNRDCVYVRDEEDFDQLGNLICNAHNIIEDNITVPDFQQILCDPAAEWTCSEGTDTWKFEYVFDSNGAYDGIYNLNFGYRDEAGNSKLSNTASFTVDHIAPSVPTITYSQSLDPVTALLDFATLGLQFYNPTVEVTVTATDMVSGVDYFSWEYNREDGASGINMESLSGSADATQGDEDHRSEFTATITLTYGDQIDENTTIDQLRGMFSATATDCCNNNSSSSDPADEPVIILDTIAPNVTVEYSEPDYYDADNLILFYGSNSSGEAVITLTVNEANFFPEDIVIERQMTYDPYSSSLGGDWVDISRFFTWTVDQENADIHIGGYTLEGEGDYRLRIRYMDESHNEAQISDDYQNGGNGYAPYEYYYSPTITIDTTPAALTLAYEHNGDVQKIVFTVAEHYFDQNRLYVGSNEAFSGSNALIYEAKDITGADVAKPDLQQIIRSAEWVAVEGEDDIWRFEYTFANDGSYDGIYDLNFGLLDKSKNPKSSNTIPNMIIDHIAPTVPMITYSQSLDPVTALLDFATLGLQFYNPTVEVTVTATDMVSGVDYFSWEYNREDGASGINMESLSGRAYATQGDEDHRSEFTATITLTYGDQIDENTTIDQLRGMFSATATDYYNNTCASSDPADEPVIILDTIAPNVTVEYSAPSYFSNNGSAFYGSENEGKAEITLTVNEANFFPEDVVVTLEKTYAPGRDPDGHEDNTTDISADISWAADPENVDTYKGTYTLTGEGDYLIHIQYMDESHNEAEIHADYQDSVYEYTSHTIRIDTTPAALTLEYVHNGDEQKVVFTVTEHYFDKSLFYIAPDSEFTGDVELVYAAKDITGAEVDKPDLEQILRSAEWVAVEGAADTWQFEYDFSDEYYGYYEGRYDLNFGYIDWARNTSTSNKEEDFIIDHTAPDTPVITYNESLPPVETVLNILTVGYLFYNEERPVEITFTTRDWTSGVRDFTWTYTREEGVSDVNDESFTKTTSATADPNDPSLFTATVVLEHGMRDIENLSVDQLRGCISAFATDNYENVDEENNTNHNYTENTVVLDTISPTMEIEYSAPSREIGTQNTVGYETYYGIDKEGKIDVTLRVNEANFFYEDVVIKVAKNEGEPERIDPVWTDVDVDNHTATFTIENDGHYIVTVDYIDRSHNTMTHDNGVSGQYVSHRMTIDTIIPVINVEYLNTNVIDTLEHAGNPTNYHDSVQTAVVTITEHNFNSEEVIFDITGSNVAGSQYNIDDLIGRTGWTDDGDVHRMTITYAGDANYSFDIEYTDLATNAAEDYQPDYFTVDTKAPTVVSVTYGDNDVVNTIGNILFFGDYMKVRIVTEDETAGVHEFNYQYNVFDSEHVSGVNKSGSGSAAEPNGFTLSPDGRSATLTFNVPLSNIDENQFNGMISFDVTDRSGNKTESNETQQFIVDTIAPEFSISYKEAINGEPFVWEVNGIRYFDGEKEKIKGTITINEANFYAEDVKATYTKDGGESRTLDVTWINESSDVHKGEFSLTEDGDYVVTVNYTDRSGKKMKEYVSPQLTLDTVIEAAEYTIDGAPVTDYVTKTDSDQTRMYLGGAHNDDPTFGFSFFDQNYNGYSVTLTRTRFNETVDVTADFINVKEDDKGGSCEFSFDRTTDNDGIYLLTVTISDKANHKATSSMKFTVNNYGSVFLYDEYLCELIADGGQHVSFHKVAGQEDEAPIYKDLTITEYNADKIIDIFDANDQRINIIITRDGERIDAQYDSNDVAVGNIPDGNETGGWYTKVYTIKKENFREDGQYVITLTSRDATDNSSSSVPENSFIEDENGNLVKVLDTMKFTVDTTPPEIRNIINLDEKIVNAQELDVQYTIVDVGGLKNITVMVNGEEVSNINSFDDLTSYSGEFKLSESNNSQTVRFIIEDLAGNKTDTGTSTEDAVNFDPGDMYTFNREVTISTNFFVRWYANSGLFWGSIGGVAAAAGGTGVLLAAKKRKKKQED